MSLTKVKMTYNPKQGEKLASCKPSLIANRSERERERACMSARAWSRVLLLRFAWLQIGWTSIKLYVRVRVRSYLQQREMKTVAGHAHPPRIVCCPAVLLVNGDFNLSAKQDFSPLDYSCTPSRQNLNASELCNIYSSTLNLYFSFF